MRTKIIKLLRELENTNGFHNKYTEFTERYNCDYNYDEYVDFPNFKALTERYNDLHKTYDGKLLIPTPESKIRAEIVRMEADGLVMIGIQDGNYYGEPAIDGFGPEEQGNAKVESIILTTKGKSEWSYFWHKAWENPVTSVLSVTALIISIIALFV